MGDLTRNFDRSEFACRCGCGFADIDLSFVEKLQAVRDRIGMAMYINSGCRCEKHNAEEGGVKHSAHMRGLAADIKTEDGELRFKLLAAALAEGFERIGIGKTFVHLDVDHELPHPRVWPY